MTARGSPLEVWPQGMHLGLRHSHPGLVAGMQGQCSVNRSDNVVNPVCHAVCPLWKGAASCESGTVRGSALGGGACGLG